MKALSDTTPRSYDTGGSYINSAVNYAKQALCDDEIKPFSLHNDGRLEVKFLGAGSAFATKSNQSNFILVKGDDHVLVDFGTTGYKALQQYTNLSVTDIEVVLPTHSHADHVGGMECFALMHRYCKPKGRLPLPRLIITEDYQRVLWDCTLRGGLEWNESPEGPGCRLRLTDFFEIVRPVWKKAQPREVYSVDVGSIHIEMFRTLHIPEQSPTWEDCFLSYGLFVDDHIFFSGDTRFDRELIDMYADRADVMFHDAQFFPGAVHAFVEDLADLPEYIGRKMFLYHTQDDRRSVRPNTFAGVVNDGDRYIFRPKGDS